VSASLDSRLSRALWLVKWVLLIPHVIILAFLWVAFVVLSMVAFFAILFTGRYLRSIFDFAAAPRTRTRKEICNEGSGRL
jgi:hypothetical protein